MTPELEAAIRDLHVKHDDWRCEAGERIRESQGQCDVATVFAALDAARGERDRLRLSFRALARIVTEEYPGSIVEIVDTWGSATDEELAALRDLHASAQ